LLCQVCSGFCMLLTTVLQGTEEWTHFYCGRWLASKEDDG